MLLSDLTVEVRDKTLARVGLIRPEELNLTVTGQFNNVGGWQLALAAEHPLAGVLRTPGAGIIVTGPTDVLMSGPVITPAFAADKDDPDGTVTFSGVSDTIVLADMLAWPQPSNPDPLTQTVPSDIRNGVVEDLLYQFVDANCGPSAPAVRRKANLVMGTNLHRGSVVTKSARFTVLGDILNELAILASLGFQVIQRGSQLVFETYAVNDRTDEIRLDLYNGTLTNQNVAITAPGVTQVIVGGSEKQTSELDSGGSSTSAVDRQFYAGTSTEAQQAETDWGRRIEQFVNQSQSDDPNEYKTKADQVLADSGFTGVSVQVIPADDATMRYGIDWTMGDKVSVVVNGGEAISICTGFILKTDKDGTKLGVVLGDPTQFSDDASQAVRLREVERRVSYLETAGNSGASKDQTDYAVLNFMGVF